MRPRPHNEPDRTARLAAALIACLTMLAVVPAAGQQTLPAEIVRLLEADPVPQVAVDPTRRHALLVHERQLLSLERLAQPAIEIAGRRINPFTHTRHAPLEYHGLTLVDLTNGERTPLSLPRRAILGYPSWAPDGSRFAFTLTRPQGEAELWIGEPDDKRVWPLVDGLSTAHGAACVWAPDSRNLLCHRSDAGRLAREADSFRALTRAPWDASSPNVMLSYHQARVLLESQLELIDSVSRRRHVIGQPAALESAEASPVGAYLLVRRIAEPYPQLTGVDATQRIREVWDRFGRVVSTLPAEARAIGWHAAKPATLVWVERIDGNDFVMIQAPPFTDEPRAAFRLPHRFGGLRFIGDAGTALISDYDPERRRTALWQVDLDQTGANAQRLADYPSAEPRIPLTATNAHGVEVALEHEGIFLRGQTLDGDQHRSFLDHVSFDGTSTRIWQSGPERHEDFVDLLTVDARRILVRREDPAAPANYFVTTPGGDDMYALTRREHPSMALANIERLRLEYLREDGLELSAALYLPPGHDDADEPPPLVVWAYPRQVLAGGSTRLPDRGERYPSSARAFRLFFLLRGYAVLDNVSMPIVGADGDANDTFIQQVRANAAAAVRAAGATGRIDATRVGIAGHSYGAFTVANLLAHSTLFDAGIALSGAYNRTLTPFGFQTERRTLWDAPELYFAMSPLLYADRIDAPLLLVHGLLDDNAGTTPIQSTQLYQAIRGTGGVAELVLLPWEGHRYRARESVLETASQMLAWFDRHLKHGDPRAQKELSARMEETSALPRPSRPSP